VNVAAGRDVVIILDNLIPAYDAAELVFFPPCLEGLGNAGDTFIRDVVLGVAFFKLAPALSKKSLPLRAAGLFLFRNKMMPGAVVL